MHNEGRAAHSDDDIEFVEGFQADIVGYRYPDYYSAGRGQFSNILDLIASDEGEEDKEKNDTVSHLPLDGVVPQQTPKAKPKIEVKTPASINLDAAVDP